MSNDNRRETGGRKLAVDDQQEPNRDPLDTGDAGDRPRRPYGLTEPSDDRGDATRHHDGKRPAGSTLPEEKPEPQVNDRRPL